MQEPSIDVAKLVAQIPDADEPKNDSKFTGPPWEAGARICDAILAGGREAILQLIAMLRDPDDQGPGDFKAGYVLHCLALHAGRPGKEAERRVLAEAMVAGIRGDKPSRAVQGLLIRELRVAGGKEVVEALGKALLDDDLCEDAAQALLAIRDGAVPYLRSALAKAKGKSRVTLAQALGVVRDAESVAALKDAIADPDRALRIAAAWALANIGDVGAVDALKNAAGAEDGWERIQATKACLLLAERLGAAGRKAEAEGLYTHLRDSRKEPAEAYVREAAERGLGAAGKRL